MSKRILKEVLFNKGDYKLLDKLFELRVNEIAELSKSDMLKEEKIKDIQTKVAMAIENIPPAFVETRKAITDTIEELEYELYYNMGCYNEKYYKNRFY